MSFTAVRIADKQALDQSCLLGLNQIEADSGLINWGVHPQTLTTAQRKYLHTARTEVIRVIKMTDEDEVTQRGLSLLRRFFLLDPLDRDTHRDLFPVVKDLSEMVRKIEPYSISVQSEIVATYAAGIQTLLAHGEHTMMIDQKEKEALSAAAKGLDIPSKRGIDEAVSSSANASYRVIIRSNMKRALEGTKRLEDNDPGLSVFQVVKDVIKVLYGIATKDIGTALEGGKDLFDKAKEKWDARQLPWFESACIIDQYALAAARSGSNKRALESLADCIYRQTRPSTLPVLGIVYKGSYWAIAVAAAEGWEHVLISNGGNTATIQTIYEEALKGDPKKPGLVALFSSQCLGEMTHPERIERRIEEIIHEILNQKQSSSSFKDFKTALDKEIRRIDKEHRGRVKAIVAKYP